MVNLLPIEQKRQAGREYYFRLFATALLLFVPLLATVLVFLGAGFLSLGTAQESTNAYSEALLGEDEEGAGRAGKVREINNAVQILSGGASPFSVSGIIRMVIEKSNGVRITSFQYNRSEKGQGSLTIRGTADRRNDLAAFADRLKAENVFQEVRTPLASFVEERNISFSIEAELLFGD